jgi:hypothetical protein
LALTPSWLQLSHNHSSSLAVSFRAVTYPITLSPYL